MPEELNALAELAEQLDRVGVELCHDQLDNESKDAIRKAQRIVAKLAKVGFLTTVDGELIAHPGDACRAVDRCRVIAEEGVNDDNA